jgi:hypothetical protein
MTLGFSTIACTASNQDTINLNAILGRWYPNSNSQAQLDVSPFLDISEETFVFDGAVVYQTTLIGVAKRRSEEERSLVFKVTGTDRTTEYGYGCGGPQVNYIRVGIMPYDSASTMLMGDRIFVDFYEGDAVLTDESIYEIFDGCIGVAFRRKEKVGYSPL